MTSNLFIFCRVQPSKTFGDRAALRSSADRNREQNGARVESFEELHVTSRLSLALLADGDSESSEVLLTFCGQAERVIELLHRSYEAHDLAALIPPISRLELSCQQLGADGMALTLGQVKSAAREVNSKTLRWLITSLSQEYATLSSMVQELRVPRELVT
jgi:hypothetical protein